MSSFSQKTHPGNMPIRVLQYNIDKRLKEFIPEKDFGSGFNGCQSLIDFSTMRTPSVNLKEKVIYLHEPYLSFTWSLTYFFLLANEYIQDKIIKQTWDSCLDFNSNKFLREAYSLFQWALTLKTSYSKWDIQLPNPEKCNSRFEEFFSPKCNDVFLDNIIYQILHEYGHIVNNHYDLANILEKKNKYPLTSDEKDELKIMENEADQYAFETFLNSTNNDVNQRTFGLKYIPIVLAHVGQFFTIREITALKQDYHSDPDFRLFQALDKFEQLGKEMNFYIRFLTSLGIQLFLSGTQLTIPTGEHENVEGLLLKQESILNDYKNDLYT